MTGACILKNYGCRTLLGNWYEERIALDKHYENKNVKTRDVTVECHIQPTEESPKWEMDYPLVTKSQYQVDTDPDLLKEQRCIQRRIRTANQRRRLQGTVTMAEEAMPGSTETPEFLSHEFIDPHKVRMKTTYEKAYCRPQTSRAISRGYLFDPITNVRPDVKPRYACTDSTWQPGWPNK